MSCYDLSGVFFRSLKLSFSGFLQVKCNLARGQDKSKYRDRAFLRSKDACKRFERSFKDKLACPSQTKTLGKQQDHRKWNCRSTGDAGVR